VGEIPSSQSRGHDMAAKWQPLSTDSTDPPLTPCWPFRFRARPAAHYKMLASAVSYTWKLHNFCLITDGMYSESGAGTGPARPTKSFLPFFHIFLYQFPHFILILCLALSLFLWFRCLALFILIKFFLPQEGWRPNKANLFFCKNKKNYAKINKFT